MGYTLLWLESLGAALLFLAMVTALFARAAWWRVPRVVPVLTALAMIGVAAVGTFLVGVFQFAPFIQTTWFGPVLCWSIVFSLGVSALLLRGLRRGAEGATRARAWPLGRLVLAFATLVVLSCITFANMDTAVKVQLASVARKPRPNTRPGPSSNSRFSKCRSTLSGGISAAAPA